MLTLEELAMDRRKQERVGTKILLLCWFKNEYPLLHSVCYVSIADRSVFT